MNHSTDLNKIDAKDLEVTSNSTRVEQLPLLENDVTTPIQKTDTISPPLSPYSLQSPPPTIRRIRKHHIPQPNDGSYKQHRPQPIDVSHKRKLPDSKTP
jgi:hypothetical protein